MSFIDAGYYLPYAPSPPNGNFAMMKQPFEFKIKDTFSEYLKDKTSAQCGSEIPAPDTCYPANKNLSNKCLKQNLWNNSTKRKTVVKDYTVRHTK